MGQEAEGLAFGAHPAMCAGVLRGDGGVARSNKGVPTGGEVELAGGFDGPIEAGDGAAGFEAFDEFLTGGADGVFEIGDGGVDGEEGAADFVVEAPGVGEAEVAGDEGEAGLREVEQEEVFLNAVAGGADAAFGEAEEAGEFGLGGFAAGEGLAVVVGIKVEAVALEG